MSMKSNGSRSSSGSKDNEAPRARLCHLKKWPHFAGYGFNLHAGKAKQSQNIGKVDPNSPAESAGIKEGDLIVEVNYVNISNENHQQVVKRIRNGLERDGNLYEDEVVLLVVDKQTDEYYKKMNEVVKSSMANVLKLKTAEPQIQTEEENAAGKNNNLPKQIVTTSIDSNNNQTMVKSDENNNNKTSADDRNASLSSSSSSSINNNNNNSANTENNVPQGAPIVSDDSVKSNSSKTNTPVLKAKTFNAAFAADNISNNSKSPTPDSKQTRANKPNDLYQTKNKETIDEIINLSLSSSEEEEEVYKERKRPVFSSCSNQVNSGFKEKGCKAVNEMLDSFKQVENSSNSLNSIGSTGSYKNHLKHVKKILADTLNNLKPSEIINSINNNNNNNNNNNDTIKSSTTITSKTVKTSLSMKKTPPPRPPPPSASFLKPKPSYLKNFASFNEENISNRSLCSESDFGEKFRLNNFLEMSASEFKNYLKSKGRHDPRLDPVDMTQKFKLFQNL